MKYYFLKPRFLSIIASSIFLISSCSDNKEESLTDKTENIHRLTDQDIIKVSEVIKTKNAEIQAKKNSAINKNSIESAPYTPYEEYQGLLAGKNLSIEIDDRMVHILDQSYEENLQYLNNLHIFSDNEIAIVNTFKDELENSKNFNTSISHFESAILSIPMTTKKMQRFYNFIDALKAMYAFDPYFFSGSITAKSSLFGSCLSASIGVGLAFVGLATIEVGSFGAATAVAVAGFIWASAEWGAACKGSGKKLYPPKIIKPIQRVNQNYITLDENGDITNAPITLFLAVR